MLYEAPSLTTVSERPIIVIHYLSATESGTNMTRKNPDGSRISRDLSTSSDCTSDGDTVAGSPIGSPTGFRRILSLDPCKIWIPKQDVLARLEG